MTPPPRPLSSSRDFDEMTPLFVISVAAELAGMHAQTLRSYDREGLVSPGRTAAGGRRYSQRDISLLREVQRLSQEQGVNRAGIKRIIELDAQVMALQARLTEVVTELAATQVQMRQIKEQSVSAVADASAAVHASYRRDIVPWKATGSAIVTWVPPKRRP